VVASDEYALACYRYIELNPGRAALVSDPRDYAWSSYRGNAESERDPLLRPHAAYQALEGSYRSLFAIDLPESLVDDIRKATRGGYRVGEKRRPRGRPKRPENLPSFRPD
jgi:putative transposase